jgi:hypothetical protein
MESKFIANEMASHIEEFKKKHTQSIRNKAMIFKDQAWFMIKDFPWHFIALEDLGVKID